MGSFGGLSYKDTVTLDPEGWARLLDRATKRGVLTGWKRCGESYVAEFAEGPYARVVYLTMDRLFTGAVAELRDPLPWREGLRTFGFEPPEPLVFAMRVTRAGPEADVEGCGLPRVDDAYETASSELAFSMADGRLVRFYRSVQPSRGVAVLRRYDVVGLLEGTDADKKAAVEAVRAGGFDALQDVELAAMVSRYRADVDDIAAREDAARARVDPTSPENAAFLAKPVAERWRVLAETRRSFAGRTVPMAEIHAQQARLYLLARALDDAIVEAERAERHATAAALAIARSRWQAGAAKLEAKDARALIAATDGVDGARARVARLFARTVPPLTTAAVEDVPRRWLADDRTAIDLRAHLRANAGIGFLPPDLDAYHAEARDTLFVEVTQGEDTLTERFGSEQRTKPIYADRGASEAEVRAWEAQVAEVRAELRALPDPGSEPPVPAYETWVVRDYTGAVYTANIGTDSEGAARRREWEWRTAAREKVAGKLEALERARPIRHEERVIGQCPYTAELKHVEGRFARDMRVWGLGTSWHIPLLVSAPRTFDRAAGGACGIEASWPTLAQHKETLAATLDRQGFDHVARLYPAIRQRAITRLASEAKGTPAEIEEERGWLLYWTAGGPRPASAWPTAEEMADFGSWPPPR